MSAATAATDADRYPPGASSARPTAAHDVYRYYQDNLAFARLVSVSAVYGGSWDVGLRCVVLCHAQRFLPRFFSLFAAQHDKTRSQATLLIHSLTPPHPRHSECCRMPMCALQVGRWVGYSVAAFFACVSLIRIVMSFKSSITLNAKWERYWEEHPEEKALVEQAGATQHSEEARQLILDAQDMAKKMGAPSQTYHYATLIVQGKQSSPFIAALGAPAAASAAPTAPGAAAAAAPQAAAAAGAALLGQAVGLGLSRNEIQPVSGVSDGVPRLTKSKKSSAAAPPGATETGLSSRLMEMLQRHEVRVSLGQGTLPGSEHVHAGIHLCLQGPSQVPCSSAAPYTVA